MEIVLLLLLILELSLSNIACFFIGAKVGQKVVKGETLEAPTIPNPIKAIEEYKESKEIKKNQEKLNTMLENINNYDGTDLGQKDIN